MPDDADPVQPEQLPVDLETSPTPPVGIHSACPYLVASGGQWRSDSPSRDHRCTAVAPAAPLALDKQRRLCLTNGHLGCATYLAAREARRARGIAADEALQIRWGVTRTTPVVQVGVGLGAAVSGLLAERRGWQAVPAVVLVVALAAIGLSGLGRDLPTTGALASGLASPSPRPEPTPSPTRPVTPSPSESPGPTPSPSAEVTPTPEPTIAPTASPISSPQTRYTVKSGDTLYDIARAFGTTVTAIKQLNGLGSTVLHVGQVLLIP